MTEEEARKVGKEMLAEGFLAAYFGYSEIRVESRTAQSK